MACRLRVSAPFFFLFPRPDRGSLLGSRREIGVALCKCGRLGWKVGKGERGMLFADAKMVVVSGLFFLFLPIETFSSLGVS